METGKIQSGIAGEYFTAGELSRRGFIASLTLKNTAGIDILSSNGERCVNIQVKTRLINKSDGWNMGNKPLDYQVEKKNIFYVLVEISSDKIDKTINYYIIPMNDLHKSAEIEYQEWIQGLQRSGKPRKSKVRFFRHSKHPELEKYRDNWSSLFD